MGIFIPVFFPCKSYSGGADGTNCRYCPRSSGCCSCRSATIDRTSQHDTRLYHRLQHGKYKHSAISSSQIISIILDSLFGNRGTTWYFQVPSLGFRFSDRFYASSRYCEKSLLGSCLSIRTEQLGFQWRNFYWNLYLSTFLKSKIFNFHQNLTRITCTSLENQYTVW
jgi:hypothetical protein